MKRVSDVLLKVHALVLRGWCQDRAWAVDDEGHVAVSLYGALRLLEAMPGSTSDIREHEGLVARAVHRLRWAADGTCQLEDWNDAPDRTQEQVLDLVDRVIDSEMEREVG